MVGTLGATWREFDPGHVRAQGQGLGWPLADEPVEATLKRLFGDRKFNSGDGESK